MTSPIPIILASASPRRAQLLTQLGLAFRVDPAHVEEVVLPGESPEAHAVRLARAKATEVRRRNSDHLILAGDTVVVLDGEILGKPGHPGAALGMLRALSGRTHSVVSALALSVPGDPILAGALSTEVTFRPFDEDLARAYVDTGEPLDKAGAYGIQGLGSVLIQEIRGDYTTVVGLPIPLLLALLESAGFRYEFPNLVRVSREASR